MLKKALKSKLNGGNLVLKYSTAFTSSRKCELQAINRKTRKLFTMYGGLFTILRSP